MKILCLILVIFCSSMRLLIAQNQPDTTIFLLTAPDSFQVIFHTTKGDFKVKAYREWAPVGVDRFYQLIKSHTYKDIGIFRVQPDYVVQFGLTDSKLVNEFWRTYPLRDEPVHKSNTKGTVAFARDGPVSRDSQIYINTKDNYKLDTINYNELRGFPPIAEVVEGMEVIHRLYAAYGFEPAEKQDSIFEKGNVYLKKNYPNIDYIIDTEIIE